jgi:lysophospholipase L1-like esterase
MKWKLLIVLSFVSVFAFAQEDKPPFWNDIQRFKKMDSTAFPKTNQILFVGSSSFTNWRDVQQYFPNHPIINRGFGGSSLPDLIRYAHEIIYPYIPKQIIIYCGENDIAGSDSVTAEIVASRFEILFGTIRKQFPNVPIAYVSMKPSPSRMHMQDRVTAGNAIIKKFLKKQKKTTYIDVYKKMLKDKRPIPEIFLSDSLHMNAKGYAIWQKAIAPHLLK